MKADLTRTTFRAEQRYARVIHPQGHVTLDAELNEAAEIGLHRAHATNTDVIGQSGTPNGDGFQLVASPDKKDLLVLPGRYYLGGTLVEGNAAPVPVTSFPSANVAALPSLTLDGRPLAVGEWLEISAPSANTHRFQVDAVDAAQRRVTVGANDVGPSPPDVSPFGVAGATVRRVSSYIHQPDWPRPADTAFPALPALPSLTLATGTYGAYLEVFGHHVTDLADPLLREVALGGIDGASREKTAWQLRLRRLGDVGTTASCEAATPAAPARRGLVSARAKKPATGTNPCIIDPLAKYRRIENQLYRVEVHAGGTLGVDSGITFKWSRENGSVVVRWVASTTSTVTVASSGRDSKLGLAAGDWIELTDDQHELGRAPATLVQIDTIEGTTINLKPGTATGSVAIADFPFNPRVRRWDHGGSVAAPPLERPATNDGYLVLEDGVEVRFEDGLYLAGDHWVIPARTITGNVEWPRDLDGLPIAQPGRDGPPAQVGLGIVEWDGTQMRVLDDCRVQFPPLSHICAKDVCLDSDPCGRGWKNVQEAVEGLCHDDDLVFHNQHLHGWGVVCGLQVNCMTVDYAASHELPRPDEWIKIRDGYAIHPTGADIRLESDAGDGVTAVELGDLAVADGVITRQPDGSLPDASVSLWIDKDKSLHTEPYDPTKKKTIADLLEDSILLEIYNGCILKVIDFLKGQVTPGADEGLVGPTAKRVITLLNLFWQLVNQTSGSHIFLSGDPDPAAESPDREDAILRKFFEGLKALLQSKSFCAMFDDLAFPAYDVQRAELPAGTPMPSTIFGRGQHTRLRIHPRRQLAFTCGNGSKINVYDLEKQLMIAETEFPVGGAEVQDVAFAAAGNQIFAIAWIGDAKVDSVFAVGTVGGDGKVEWSNNQVQCHLKLCTLATSSATPGLVYAAARGQGIFPFNPGALTPTPTAVRAFFATGHLVAAARGGQTVLYAGAHATDSNPVAFNQVIGFDVKTPDNLLRFNLPPDGGTPGLGHDDLALAVAPNRNVDAIYAIIDGANGTKRLVVWSPSDAGAAQPAGANAQRVVALPAGGASHVAYSPAGNWSLVTFQDTYLGRAYRPDAAAVETDFHPLQIGPASVATDVDGRFFYVLEFVSNTITVVPAVPTAQTPWVSSVDVAKLQAYRQAVIVVFLKMLGRFAQFLKDCICEHLLVDCPDPTGKKVYLADVSFKNGKIFQICNFHHRRYVHTFPTVERWLSFVPILPLLKQAVEKMCCSVLTGVFDKLAPAANAANAKPDRFSVTMVQNGLTFLKQANIKTQFQSRKAQVVTTALVGRNALATALERPAAGKTSSPVGSVDLLNRSSEDAVKVARDKGLTVRGVTVADEDLGTILRGTVRPPILDPGDTIELVTNRQGRVIGISKTSGTAPSVAQPAAAASAEELATLRRELADMRKLHDKQSKTISGLQSSVTEMNDRLVALKK